jgi:flagellar biosynthesis protein
MPDSAGRDPQRPLKATALRWRGGSGAPEVVASGRGLIAERMLEEARRAGVPVREEPALAEALGRLELGVEIPGELYAAVAETLAWAYRMDARSRERPA